MRRGISRSASNKRLLKDFQKMFWTNFLNQTTFQDSVYINHRFYGAVCFAEFYVLKNLTFYNTLALYFVKKIARSICQSLS